MAQIIHRALGAFGRARGADIAAVQNEPMVGVLEVFFWDNFEEVGLHRLRGFATAKAEAVGEAEDVGIDRDGGVAVEGVEHHVGGFAADAGEFFQFFSRVGDLALMLGDEQVAEGDHVFGLGAEQADGADGLAKIFFAPFQHRLGGLDFGEEGLGGFIDGNIGGLGGHHHGNEQLVGVGIGQFGGGIWVVLLPDLEHGFNFG